MNARTSARSLSQLRDDLLDTARLAGVAADPASIDRVLKTFGHGFASGAVEFRTTTRAERQLSYRYVDLDGAQDPLRLAREAAHLPAAGTRPVDRLIPDLQARFEVLGWGVDCEVSHGLEKLWPFFAYSYDVAAIAEVPSMPDALKAAVPACKKHGFTHATVVAADYRHESTNVYFMIPPPQARTKEQVAALLAELGLEPKQAPDALLAYAASGVALNLTFAWSSPHVERACLYVPAPSPDAVPSAWVEPLIGVVREAPIAAPQRGFIVGPTFTRAGLYTKLEIDYSGTTLGVLQQCVGIQPRASDRLNP